MKQVEEQGIHSIPSPWSFDHETTLTPSDDMGLPIRVVLSRPGVDLVIVLAGCPEFQLIPPAGDVRASFEDQHPRK